MWDLQRFPALLEGVLSLPPGFLVLSSKLAELVQILRMSIRTACGPWCPACFRREGTPYLLRTLLHGVLFESRLLPLQSSVSNYFGVG